MMRSVKTNKAPAAIGPYSQAIVIGNMVYTAGQIPISPDTGSIVSEDITEQTKQALENLSEVLKASGTKLSNIIKTTVYITDMTLFSHMNAVYEKYFVEPYPARSCVEVSKLPKDVMIEIEAVAHLTIISK